MSTFNPFGNSQQTSDPFADIQRILEFALSLRKMREDQAYRQEQLQMERERLDLSKRQASQQAEGAAISADVDRLKSAMELREALAMTNPEPVPGMGPTQSGEELMINPESFGDIILNLPALLKGGQGLEGSSQVRLPALGRDATVAAAGELAAAKRGDRSVPVTEMVLSALDAIAPRDMPRPEIGSSIRPEMWEMIKKFEPRQEVTLPGIPFAPPGTKARNTELELAGSVYGHNATAQRAREARASTQFNEGDPGQVSAVDAIVQAAASGQFGDLAGGFRAAQAIGKGGGEAYIRKLEELNLAVLPKPVRTRISEYDGVLSYVDTVRAKFREYRNMLEKDGLTAEAAWKAAALDKAITASATVVPRSFGERGATSDPDIKRAVDAMPTWFKMTVAPKFVEEQLATIESLARGNRSGFIESSLKQYDKRGSDAKPKSTGAPTGRRIGDTSMKDGTYYLDGNRSVTVYDGGVYEN